MDDLDHRILTFEKQRWRRAGAKEAAIRAEFGLTAIGYYQLLSRLLSDPAAAMAEPVLIARLRRLVERKRVA